jgi:predicted DCC family thiol-disulfide oxidoreductase YuxK
MIEYKHDRVWFWSGAVIRFVKHAGGRWRFMAWTGPKLDAGRLPA